MKLFYSFTFLLAQLRHGVITPTDLQAGLFAFQVSRSLVLFDNLQEVEARHFLEGNYEDEERNPLYTSWVGTLQPVVLQAEKEGRAIWRADGERYLPYKRLAGFLNDQGFFLPESVPPDEELRLWITEPLRAFLSKHAPGLELVAA